MKPKWAISIRTHEVTKMFMLRGKEGQSNLDFYKEVIKLKVQELRDKFTGNRAGPVTIDVISRQVAFKPPKDKKIPRNHYWCPYCIKPRIFVHREKTGNDHCPICGVSDQDFYVKKFNGIFRREFEEYAMRGARK
ncbi:MAG: hypothetical protein HF312_17215 [Ignavibacteria bacterium]|jgi:rubrerythrin|nr:hypothetical protein [Ignavibacteria bacterium]